MISEILPDGPAARANLQTGDVLRDFDGEEMSGADHLHRVLTPERANTALAIRVLRRGKLVEVVVRPGPERPGSGPQ